MSERARVRSIDALAEFRAALAVFADEAQQALLSVDADVARVEREIGSDLPRFWKGELRRREEDAVRARLALEQAISMAKMGKSTVDERKALERAKRAVESARSRIEASKRWARELEHERLIYQGQVEPLARFAESGSLRAADALQRMIDNLEQYVSLQGPAAAADGANEFARGASHAPNDDAPLDAQTLRTRLPSPDQIARAEDALPGALPAFKLGRDDRARLGTIVPHAAPDARAWILVADSARGADRIAFHRSEPAAPDDSGWRALGAESATPDAWCRVPILALLRKRPALHDLLRIGEGWTVVVSIEPEGRVLEAFDPEGLGRWGSIHAEAE